MKFIKDIEGYLLNMEKVEYVFIDDLGADYPERFLITAIVEDREYTIRKYKTETCANGFIRRIHEKYKFEPIE
jgi:hypothetical protein